MRNPWRELLVLLSVVAVWSHPWQKEAPSAPASTPPPFVPSLRIDWEPYRPPPQVEVILERKPEPLSIRPTVESHWRGPDG